MSDEDPITGELRDLRAAIDESTILSVTDADGVITRVNDRFCALTGFTADEIVGRTYALVASGVHSKAFFDEIWTTIRGGRTWRGEICNRSKNGTLYWLATTIVPFLDADGHPVRYFSIQTDITARKNAEETVRRSERLRGEILDAISSQVAVLDHDGTVLSVNKGWIDYMDEHGAIDFLPPDVVGQNYLDFCDAAADSSADAGAIGAGVREVLGGGRATFTREFSCRRCGGAHWFLMSAVPLRFDHGGAVVTHTDVTARKKVEERQRESEEIIRLLVDHAPAAVAMLDREMRYMAVTKRWLADYGPSSGDPGKSLFDTFPAAPDAWREAARECLDGRERGSESTEVLLADSRRVDLKWEMHPWSDRRGAIGGIVVFTENITKRRRIEQALRDSENRYRALFDSHPLPVWVEDTESRRIVAANDAALALYDYPRPRFTRLFSKDLCGERQPGADPETPRRANPERHFRRDGTEIEVEVTDQIIPLGGMPARIVTVHDVTEERRLARRLSREKEEKLSILESLAEAFVSLDREFRYVYLNPAAEGQLGKTLGELRGKVIWDAFPEIVGTRFEREYKRAMSDREFRLFEEYFEAFGRWYEIRVFPSDVGISVFFRDITSRRRAEELDREKNQLLEQTYDAIFVWNPEDGIVSWNANAERLYGYTAEESLGKNPRDLLKTDYPTTSERHLENLLRFGVWEGELLQTDKTGERVIVESRQHLIRRGGTKPMVLQTSRDVTERRRLESRLARTAKLALVGELAAGLAHEIKNPLAGIKGVVDILTERRRRDGSEEAEILESVGREIARIDRTVRMLLHNSRPKALDIRPAPLDDTIRRAAKFAIYQAKRHASGNGHDRVVLELPEGHSIVPHDESGLEDAVLNLILNAEDAVGSDPRGQIRIRLRADDTEAVIEVSDNGPGIDAEQLKEIFLPFVTSKTSGTGLGLTSVKRIARAHGGDCSVASKPGEGSNFRIHIPLRQPSTLRDRE